MVISVQHHEEARMKTAWEKLICKTYSRLIEIMRVLCYPLKEVGYRAGTCANLSCAGFVLPEGPSRLAILRFPSQPVVFAYLKGIP